MELIYIIVIAFIVIFVFSIYFLIKYICKLKTREAIKSSFKTGKVWLYVLFFIIGTALAIFFAINGGIGPEPPRTEFGRIVSIIYYPYFETFCAPLDVVGFFIAVIIHGLVFAVLCGLIIKAVKKYFNRQKL